jgi:hypothetical protein
MVSKYGMSTDNVMLNYEVVTDEKLVAEEVTKISKKLYNEIESLLSINKDALAEVAEALIENETLYEVDVDTILVKYNNFKDLIDMSKHSKEEIESVESEDEIEEFEHIEENNFDADEVIVKTSDLLRMKENE